MERLSFNNYNEGTLLIESLERYKERFGCYPEAVLADQIYRTRDNRMYCKKRGIRLSGPPLGRPKASEVKVNKQLERQDAGERNAVEGKFGEGKRSYKLDRIFARLQETGETVIAMQLLVMNLEKRLRLLLHFFLESLAITNLWQKQRILFIVRVVQ
jgi:IS5 family transposase